MPHFDTDPYRVNISADTVRRMAEAQNGGKPATSLDAMRLVEGNLASPMMVRAVHESLTGVPTYDQAAALLPQPPRDPEDARLAVPTPRTVRAWHHWGEKKGKTEPRPPVKPVAEPVPAAAPTKLERSTAILQDWYLDASKHSHLFALANAQGPGKETPEAALHALSKRLEHQPGFADKILAIHDKASRLAETAPKGERQR